VIVWLDARGFIFAAPVAFALQKPFVMIRKKGKLPGDILSHEYSLEYGSNSISIQKNAIIPWQKVAIIDDVLATWWTAQASAELITQLGGVMQGMHFVIELVFLHGRDKLAKHHLSSVISL
jgi:adenine phosphoribosyltransferase